MRRHSSVQKTLQPVSLAELSIRDFKNVPKKLSIKIYFSERFIVQCFDFFEAIFLQEKLWCSHLIYVEIVSSNEIFDRIPELKLTSIFARKDKKNSKNSRSFNNLSFPKVIIFFLPKKANQIGQEGFIECFFSDNLK